MSTLLLGCGNRRVKVIQPGGEVDWNPPLVTVDIDPNCGANFLWDLTSPNPLPFSDNSFDEIHMYEVLEHIGQQGDYRTFFRQFSDYHRILKPNGVFCASVPAPGSRWVWGDPSHTRAIPPECLVFLSQATYEEQVGKTSMTDFRWMYKADFELTDLREIKGDTFFFALIAKKP